MILKQADLSDSSDELDSYVKSVLQYCIHKSCSFFFMLQTSSHFEVTCGRHAVKTQLSYLLANGGTQANNWPLYWPSSGCTSYYKVTIQYAHCLLLMTRSRSP
jgi:hypothetical protein